MGCEAMQAGIALHTYHTPLILELCAFEPLPLSCYFSTNYAFEKRHRIADSAK
jgi:hypothetical protein